MNAKFLNTVVNASNKIPITETHMTVNVKLDILKRMGNVKNVTLDVKSVQLPKIIVQNV